MATTTMMTTKTTRGATINKNVDVIITSDLMCPWCWIGLRKLQKAMDELSSSSSSEEQVAVSSITWKPYLLRPDLPLEGAPKGGTPQSRVGRLQAAGNEVGINFTGLTDRTPNTLLFHATMAMLYDVANKKRDDSNEYDSEEEDDWWKVVNAFQEAAFEAYFTLGIYPDKDGLVQCARKVGLESHVVALYQESKEGDAQTRLEYYLQKARKEAREASMNRAVSGVPSFAFNGRTVFSGAQSVETFVRYLRHCAE